MSTLDELAEEYANRLKSAEDPGAEVQRIARSISGLKYTTGEELPNAVRQQIVEKIRDRLTRPRTEGGYMIKEADNKAYLQMLNLLQQLVNKK